MRKYYSESYRSSKSRGVTLKSLLGVANLEERLSSALNDINNYAGDHSGLDIIDSYDALHVYAYSNLLKGAIQTLSGGKEWINSNYSLYSSYFQEMLEQQFLWHNIVRSRPKNNKTLQRILSEQSGLLVGFSSLCCSKETFKKINLLVLSARDKNYFKVKSERKFAAQTFMIQLGTDYLDLPQRDWSDYFEGEPLFDEILIHWKDDDATVLNGLLVQLCNRHTHHTRASTAKDNHDFDHLALYHFPVEVLMVYRLRQWLGLALPQVKHPLMKAPFDKLPEIKESYNDELLEKVKARARRDYPDFEQVIAQSIEQAKQWQPNEVDSEKEATLNSVDTKQQLMDSWLKNEMNYAPLLDGQKVTFEIAGSLIQKDEINEVGVLLTHSIKGYKHLKTTPVANFVSMRDTNEVWHPAALLQDWSILRGWAIDMADDQDEIQNFISRRLSLLDVTVPNLSTLTNAWDNWNQQSNASPYDLFDAQIEAANQVLEVLGYSLVSMDIGRSEYVIYLVSLAQKKAIISPVEISGIEVRIEG